MPITEVFKKFHAQWLVGGLDPTMPTHIAAGCGTTTAPAASRKTLVNEMYRMAIDQKSRRVYTAQFISAFAETLATGLWTEMGLFNADAVTRLIDACDAEGNWFTDSGNLLSSEISSFREGSAALEAAGAAKIRFRNNWLTLPASVGDSDDFGDATLSSYWTAIEYKHGTVTEGVGVLTCEALTKLALAGVTSAQSYDLTSSEIHVKVAGDECHETGLAICLTKPTGSASSQGRGANWYLVKKHKGTSGDPEKLKVERMVNSVHTVLYSENWTDSDGELTIRIKNGKITFYEDENERYEENYALSSYSCYIYLYTWATKGNLGTAEFSNYITSVNPVITLADKLQFYYYIDDIDLVMNNLIIWLGNDNKNFWRFRFLKADLVEGWQWLQVDLDSKSPVRKVIGSPSLNYLIRFFRAKYWGSGALSSSLIDRIDYIRFFQENGNLFCWTEVDPIRIKGVKEARHVSWFVKALADSILE